MNKIVDYKEGDIILSDGESAKVSAFLSPVLLKSLEKEKHLV